MSPGGKPVIEAAGHIPTLPETTVGPVLVTLGVAPRTAKVAAVPRFCAVAEALASRSRATAALRIGDGKNDCLIMECLDFFGMRYRSEYRLLANLPSVRQRT